ncbi:Disease resistance-like protein DSC1 [Glycine soja]
MVSKTTIRCSSSPFHAIMTHDVFVSFRGEDIHTSFTGFLFQALGRKCTIVVFSINYAFSTIRNKLQYAELEDIVEKIITNMLGHKFSSLPNDDLVEMESRVEELAKLLRLGSVNDIQLVGISRMGGIGKTTIGHAFYVEISHQYDFCCFIDDAADYLEALVFKNESSFPQNIIRADALCKMSHRKLLVLDKMNFSGRLDNLSNELRYLTWDIYPFEGLLPSFDPDKLVGLLLPNSNIKQLWEDTKTAKVLPSYHISILGLNSLEYLILNDCSKLYLLPSSPIFPCIYKLDLSFCNLLQIPDAIGNLCCLESLDLSGNNFAGLLNLKELSILFHLNLQHCKQLKHLPELPSRIDFPSHLLTYAGLYVFKCPKLVEGMLLEHRFFMDDTNCSELGTNIQLCLQYMEHHQYKKFDYPLMNVTLGNEIPRWFNNQHLGSLISIDASPIMDDNNWIDIACCAIFVANLGSMKQEFKIISYKPGFDVEDLELSNLTMMHSGNLLAQKRKKKSRKKKQRKNLSWTKKGCCQTLPGKLNQVAAKSICKSGPMFLSHQLQYIIRNYASYKQRRNVVGDSTKESGMQILNMVFGCSRKLVLAGQRYYSFGSCNVYQRMMQILTAILLSSNIKDVYSIRKRTEKKDVTTPNTLPYVAREADLYPCLQHELRIAPLQSLGSFFNNTEELVEEKWGNYKPKQFHECLVWIAPDANSRTTIVDLPRTQEQKNKKSGEDEQNEATIHGKLIN